MLAPTIDYTSDPNYVIVDGVPILDEHELFIPGNPEKGTKDQRLKITPQVLQHICDNNNRRVHQTGDTVQLVLGHTKDDAPEDEQPEILGEADTFRVGPLFNTGRQAILSRWKLSKDPEKLKKVKGVSRRSVELWTDRWEIDPIAILKSTPPERDLGILRLSRMESRSMSPDGKVRYKLHKYSLPVQYAETPMQPNPTPSPTGVQPTQQAPGVATAPLPSQPMDPGMMQQITSALMQSDVMVKMQQMLENLSQQVQQLTQGMMPPGMNPNAIPTPGQQPGMGQPQPGMPGADPMMAMIQQLMGGMGQPGQEGPPQNGQQKDEERDDAGKVKLDANQPGMSFPGPGNTFLPTTIDARQNRQPPRVPPMQYQQTGQPVLPTPGQPVQTPVPTPVPQQLPALGHVVNPGEDIGSALVRLARERDDAVKLAQSYQIAYELAQLDKDGVEFDAQHEVPVLLQMDQPARYARYAYMRQYNRNRNAAPTVPGVPGLPNVVGQRVPVPVQYQRQPEVPGQADQVTPEEHAQIVDIMCAEKQAGRDPGPNGYRICLSRLRAGRNGQYREPVY